MGKYNDCFVFDEGPNAADTTIDAIGTAIRNLPGSILEDYITMTTYPDPNLRRPVKQVALNPDTYAAQMTLPVKKFLTKFNAGIRAVKIDRQFDALGPLVEEEILEKRWEILNEQIKAAGGIDQVMFAFLPETLALNTKEKPKNVSALTKVSAKEWQKKMTEILASDRYNEFYGADGKKHSFTAEDKKVIAAQAEAVFAKVEKSVVKYFVAAFDKAKADLGTLSNGGVVRDEDVVNTIQKNLGSLVEKVVLSVDKDAEKILGKNGTAGVWVNRFKYRPDTRASVAGVLTTFGGNYTGWSANTSKAIGTKFKAAVHGQLNISNLKEFKAEALSPSIANWYTQQKAVAAKLKTAL